MADVVLLNVFRIEFPASLFSSNSVPTSYPILTPPQPPDRQPVPQLPQAPLVAQDEAALPQVSLPHGGGVPPPGRPRQQRQQRAEGRGQVGPGGGGGEAGVRIKGVLKTG